MKRLLLMVFFLVGFVRADELFDQANTAYDAGRFRDAAEGYEKLLERDGPRVAVLQNLGSAYHQLGEEGRAILAFERALLLDPGDPDLQANLKLVRDSAAVYPTAVGSRWERFAAWISRRAWSWIALGGAVLLPVAALGWLGLRGRGGRGWMIPLAAGGVVVTGLSMAALETTAKVAQRGIVVADPATLRISPFETAEEKGKLVEGREVVLGDDRDGWFRVSVEGAASEGWVAPGEVEPLVPR